MTDRQVHHDSMVRRTEASQKALSSHVAGRSHRTGIARALQAALDEVSERMDLAWAVLKEPPVDTAAGQRYRSINAGEISLCYTIIRRIYDELCVVNAIPKAEQTEPTLQDLIREAKQHEGPRKRIHQARQR